MQLILKYKDGSIEEIDDLSYVRGHTKDTGEAILVYLKRHSSKHKWIKNFLGTDKEA